jgi:membrane protease YdiL (CAAX protease family)
LFFNHSITLLSGEFFPFFLLGVSLLFLRASRLYAPYIFGTNLIVGAWWGCLSWVNALIFGVLYIILILYQVRVSRETGRWINVIIFSLISLFLIEVSLHAVKGFQNCLLFSQIQVSPLSVPYNLYVNYDKGLVALLLLSTLLSPSFNFSSIFRLSFWGILGLSLLILMLPGLFSGFIKYDPKIPEILGIWVPVMLVYVCLPEELLYRGFIQNQLSYRIRSFPVVLILSSFVFALAHYKIGSAMMGLSFIAGLIYGGIYKKFQSLDAAILTHFAVNLIHLLFFTYPASIRL